jgi:GLPGLI family protein
MIGQGKPLEDIKSGKIYYDEKIKLQIKLEGDAAQYAETLPKERKSVKTLSFSNNVTLFEESSDISDAMTQSHEEEGIRINIVSTGANKIYTDLKNKKIIEQRDFMNRMFLVEQDLPVSNWKITGNQKEILGYPCNEAVKQDSAGIKTIVWFSPVLETKGGPATFSDLPGMVLEADVNGGARTYIATSISAVPEKDLKIKKPGDGKKVTEAEYKKIVSDKMKEMGVDEGAPGEGAHVRIIIKK